MALVCVITETMDDEVDFVVVMVMDMLEGIEAEAETAVRVVLFEAAAPPEAEVSPVI